MRRFGNEPDAQVLLDDLCQKRAWCPNILKMVDTPGLISSTKIFNTNHAAKYPRRGKIAEQNTQALGFSSVPPRRALMLAQSAVGVDPG